MIRTAFQPVPRTAIHIVDGDGHLIARLDPETREEVVEDILDRFDADRERGYAADTVAEVVSASAQWYLAGAAQAWGYAYAFAVRFGVPEITMSAIAAARHFRTVRLQTWGYDCRECLGECEVVVGELPASPSPTGSPAEDVFGDCPTCRGHGLVLPTKGSRLDVTV